MIQTNGFQELILQTFNLSANDTLFESDLQAHEPPESREVGMINYMTEQTDPPVQYYCSLPLDEKNYGS